MIVTGSWKVGILLFDEVEVLDFAGPFEVFSITEALQEHAKPFGVYTVAQEKRLIRARNGLLVMPHYSFCDAPDPDILIVPGGYGAEEVEIHNETLIRWIAERAEKAALAASVCTGAFLLAKAGLLDNKSAVTHWMDAARLEKEYPHITVMHDRKFADEGKVVTSAGISAGIDMCLHIVKRLLGAEVARNTAKRMEYTAHL